MIKFIHEFSFLEREKEIALCDKNCKVFCSVEVTPSQKYLLYEERSKKKHDIYFVTNPLFLKKDFNHRIGHSIQSDFVYFRDSRNISFLKKKNQDPLTLCNFSIEIDPNKPYSCYYYLSVKKDGRRSGEVLITKEV